MLQEVIYNWIKDLHPEKIQVPSFKNAFFKNSKNICFPIDANCSNFVQPSLSCMGKLGDISRSSTAIDPFDNYDVPKMPRYYPVSLTKYDDLLNFRQLIIIISPKSLKG